MTGTDEPAAAARWPRSARGVLLLAGCGFRGAYSLQPARRRRRRRRPVHGQVEFLDVLDLVPQSGVRVADVPVGRVDKIELDRTTGPRWSRSRSTATSTCRPTRSRRSSSRRCWGRSSSSSRAPGNEKPEGDLRDAPAHPARADQPQRRGRGAARRAVAGAQRRRLAQLQTINRELGEALQGRESAVRSTLDRARHVHRRARRRRSRRSTARWTAPTPWPRPWPRAPRTIETALDTIGPGLDVINQQRDLLVSMLQSLARLGDVGTRIINQSAADTVADLQLLQPILTQLAAAGPDLAGSLDLLLTYPFPASSVIGPATPQLPAGPAHRRVRAVHQHDGDASNSTSPRPLCRYVDRPGHRRAEDRARRTSRAASAARPARRRATRTAAAPAVPRPGRPVLGLPGLPGDSSSQVPGADARPPARRPARSPGGPAVITRRRSSSCSPSRRGGARHVLPRLQVRRAGPRCCSAPATTSPRTSRDSGGIFVNAEVTYRGVAVGRVSDMKLIDDGVRVVLTIDPGAADIPADTEAIVATRSAVGEQYVLLQPDDDKGPYLEDGSVIPKDRTSIPVPVEQLLLNMDELVGSLDQENLRIVVDELGQAFAGAGDDLGRLIDNGDLLLARAEQSLPQTLQLITDGQTVLDTQNASRSAIQPWASDLRLVTDTLVDIDPDLRQLRGQRPERGGRDPDAGRGRRARLGSLVRNLDILNKVTIPRLDGVEQMLVTYPDVVSGGFTVVRNDRRVMRAHFGFVLNSDDPHACISGYRSTAQTPSPGAVAAPTPVASPAT